MVEKINSFKKIFGEKLMLVIPLAKLIEQESNSFSYTFMDNEVYNKKLEESMSIGNLSEVNRIYWEEILMRVQWGSFSGLFRTLKWIDMALDSYKSENYIGFCSSLRGLIESVADFNYVFKATPFYLGEQFGSIKASLEEKYTNLFFKSKFFEDRLIHFTHARKNKDKNSPKSHNLVSTKDYLESFEGKSKGEFYKFWTELCEIVHPSSYTIFLFCDGNNTNTENKINLNTKKDALMINDLIGKNRDFLDLIMSEALMLPILNLKTLSLFDLDKIEYKTIKAVSLNQFKDWNFIKENLQYKEIELEGKDLILK